MSASLGGVWPLAGCRARGRSGWTEPRAEPSGWSRSQLPTQTPPTGNTAARPGCSSGPAAGGPSACGGGGQAV